MKELTRKAVLDADDLKIEPVEVPEWSGQLHVKTLTAAERAEWLSGAIDAGGDDEDTAVPDMRPRLVVYAACDKDGKPLFTVADVEALGAKNGVALDRVFAAAAELNRVGAEAVEDAEKNSGAASDGSISA